ncbi:hypothetical protein V2J09_011173 [Rumex salicifolius]
MSALFLRPPSRYFLLCHLANVGDLLIKSRLDIGDVECRKILHIHFHTSYTMPLEELIGFHLPRSHLTKRDTRLLCPGHTLGCRCLGGFGRFQGIPDPPPSPTKAIRRQTLSHYKVEYEAELHDKWDEAVPDSSQTMLDSSQAVPESMELDPGASQHEDTTAGLEDMAVSLEKFRDYSLCLYNCS